MQTILPSGRLMLAPHVRACLCGDQLVLLDLRRNRYLGLGAAASKALASWVEGWPTAPESSPGSPPPAKHPGLMESLAKQGIIVNSSSNLPAATGEFTLLEATRTLGADAPPADTELGAGLFAKFLTSAAIASWWLRTRSLEVIAGTVAKRRTRSGGSIVESLDLVQAHTAAYERLRPFVFTARDQCLYDSLALLGFLARECIFPRWVIGVKTGPFGAHSWLQIGNTVVNDQHEHVRRFSPILVV